ncbi:hypothetical protein LHYA1_G005112 [Lachnellula hyalina]|uniref:Uncharacterized protein n=1 Tax=Lachnellula hyalina TaxID=1316788 RepID=A0A8H8TX16_9HELO|nr:uncharacterized protein LHYA1_G005112 [Lachnellula hyalina]TVY25524.1 hypothetical protein LHYA1_G005112 [Lachnellula hyalina]
MADAMLSSPDPLQDTPAFQAPPKLRRASKARSSLPSKGSSPKKQTFNLDVGDQISPQKIRVTVEAGESDNENAYTHYIEGRDSSPSKSRAPNNRRRERTTTTRVPVKGLSDSGEETQHVPTPKRGRGRPRKSIGTPIPAKKRGRAGTPTKKVNARRKSVDVSGNENEEDGSFQIGKGVEIGRGKGRPRSRSKKTAAQKSTPASEQPASDQVVSSITSKKEHGRRETLLPEDVAVLEDTRNDAGMENNGAGELEEISGALQPIDSNDQYPSSAYSTIRSINAIEDAYPDVTIARFHPGEETPRKAGWSSPRIVEPIQQSPLTHVGMVSVPPSDRYQSEDRQDEGGEDDEARDGLGDMGEFDTILESEGFSMISVDSVHSLREHLSSPMNQKQESEPAKPLKNQNLLSVQEAVYDDSFSEIPEEVLEAATPARKAPNRQLLSVPNPRLDDTFSGILPEILESTTPAPAQTSQVSRLMSSNKSRVDKSISRRATGAPETSTSAEGLPKEIISAQKPQNQEFYEDSFSAIPEDVLEAATPAPKVQAVLKPAGCSISNGLQPPTSKLDLSRSQQTLSPRLLTPEETPSPPIEPSTEKTSQSSGKASSHSSGGGAKEKIEIESSINNSHMPSSPPSIASKRYTYTAHLRKNRQLNPDSTETPSIVFSSPSLPPLVQQPRRHPNSGQSSETSQRPPLSPVARAGRVLQDIHIPSSPRSRSQSLGSPFKSPNSDRQSPSVAREAQPFPSQDRSARPLPQLDFTGNLTASSQSWNRQASQGDPFHDNIAVTNSSHEREFSLEVHSPRSQDISHSRLSTIRSDADSVRSDDAMSWQAENEVPLSGSALSTNNSANLSVNTRSFSAASTGKINSTGNQRDAAERADISKQIESARPSEVIVIDSEDDRPSAGRGDEDEDFDLLLETMNSSSPIVSPYQSQGPSKEVFEKPRRSKIPSPWRKNSKRLVYNDELSSPTLTSAISLGKNIAGNASSKPVTVKQAFTAHQESDNTNDVDLSGWQIPQKSNFQPRPRESGNLDLSALFANSPPKKLPVLSTSSRNTSSRVEGNSDRSQPRETSSIDSRLNRPREETSFAPIPQKQGFNPRPRSEVASSPLKQPILGLFDHPPSRPISTPRPESSSSATHPLVPSSHSRSNIQANIQTPAAASPDYLNDSASSLTERENQLNITRTLKWTKNIHLSSSSSSESHAPALTSPTKSILRSNSPFKTPSATSSNLSPSKAVTFVSSSPIPPSPSLPLSATTWSHGHWLLLDRILQSWKPGSEKVERKKRNSTRVVSRLLGRKVHDARGESMVMEQWHLEVVDEFRGNVDGWEEKGVAMRVFALLIGEGKRREREKGGGEAEWE